jgi:predicted ABC-type ATPase
MLYRIKDLLNQGKTFAFETTLSTKSYKNVVKIAQENGYIVILLFFWLQSIDLALERVKQRVIEGGHNIDPNVICRRYYNGIKNLFQIYLPIVNKAMLFDNSDKKYQLIAEKQEDELFIIDEIKFKYLKKYQMKNNKKNISDREKILLGMDKVCDNLIALKKRMNSDLVVLRDGKILHIKP